MRDIVDVWRIARRWRAALAFETKIALSYAGVALILIGSLTIFGLSQARQQDRSAFGYGRQAISSALDAREANFRSWLKGYAYWDEIFAHMVVASDEKWANANIGREVWATFTMPMSGVYLTDESDRVRYQYWAKGPAPELRDFHLDLRRLRALADATETPAVSRIVYRSQPYFLGVARIRPMDRALARQSDAKRYLLLLQPVAGRLLDEIAGSSTIRGLRWVPASEIGGHPSIDMFPDPEGGRIVWTPRRPGATMLRRAALPMIALIVATILVGYGQFVLARRLGRLLRQKQAEAEAEASNSRAASALAATTRADAEALLIRLREQEGAVHRLSEEREADREQRKAQARAQALATLALFEQDFDTALRPVSAISGKLAAQSIELESEAAAGRRAAAVVVESATRSMRAIQTVIAANAALELATGSLDAGVTEAVDSTRRAEWTIDELVRRLDDLSANASAVEDVVATVVALAGRINMLAVNARIEAARAGEAGRGFAVVADEVNQLADLTTTATQSIASVLRTMQGNTQTATSGIDAIRGIVQEITQVTATSRSALDRQTVVAADIRAAVASASSHLAETDGAIHHLDRVIGSSESLAKALTTVAGDLGRRSELLQERAGQFADSLKDRQSPEIPAAGRPSSFAA
ncbi:methyl-accepting chemotaxis protein [Sphingomonas sp. BIUV-7]|uniref:Methyl-accepting chemotaxis protein n=1 Tax=Sphingomonas natans TaxID=3063330 RepID=A0ABT8Y767_9SPHN|nr:methyl-accepting chemotaxis protein [Sphingomonas sp. BIUV-7]MDO6413847.1 methyl-accepting chemotaxis protein [Sphingomonas sp. BIUV-7]